jgi:hypothetical protein
MLRVAYLDVLVTLCACVWHSFIHSLRLGFGLDDGGVGIRFPVEARDSPLHNVRIGNGAYAASYTMDTVDYFPRG